MAYCIQPPVFINQAVMGSRAGMTNADRVRGENCMDANAVRHMPTSTAMANIWCNRSLYMTESMPKKPRHAIPVNYWRR